MNIKKELKLNRFKMVRIPTRGELYRQYGEIQGKMQFSGDEIAKETADRKSERYAQSAEDFEAYDRMRQAEEDAKK